MEELPEEVGWVVVGVASGGRAKARIHADEDANEARGERVGKVVDEVGVFAGGSIAGGSTFGFWFLGRGRRRLLELLGRRLFGERRFRGRA